MITDYDMSLVGEFGSIRGKVDEHLLDAVGIAHDVAVLSGAIHDNLHSLLHLHLNRASHSPAYTVDIHILLNKLECASLQFRQVEDIADELQQEFVILFHNLHHLIFLGCG